MATDIPPPPSGGFEWIRRFSVAEYHRLIEIGVLTDEDRVELIEGYLVLKTPENPPHDGTLDLVKGVLRGRLPHGWLLRSQQAITLQDSEPEPDFALTRHPGAADIGVVVEVSEITLDRDRTERSRIYARAGIPVYWIVNLVDRHVEVRTAPGVVNGLPAYTLEQHFAPGDDVPLVLDGAVVAMIPVSELLP